MKNIRSTLDWSTPNLLPPSLLFGWQIEKQLLGPLGEILCFSPIPHYEDFQLGLFISMVKRLFLSFLWISSKSLSFFSLSLKYEKGPSAESYPLTSSLSPFPAQSVPRILCVFSLYFPAGNVLESHVPLKCPMNFSLLRTLSKLPSPTPWRKSSFALNNSLRLFQNKEKGKKNLLYLLKKENVWKPKLYISP